MKKWLIISLFISIISIIGVMFYTLDPQTLESIRNIRLEFLLLALCLHLLSYLLWGLRTRSMCKFLGFDVSIPRAVEIVTSSTFLASVTPSSIGGEPLRVHLLGQENVPVGSATAVVLGERLLDGVLILVSAPIALHLFRGVISISELNTLVVMGELLLSLTFLIVIYAVWHPHHTKKAFNYVIHRVAVITGKADSSRLERLTDKLDMVIDDFHSSMYTILFWIVEFAMVPVILMGLNQPPAIVISFAAQVLLMILLVLPITPGSSGIAELGATSLFSLFVPVYLIGIVVVAWRAFTLYLNLIVGGFVSFKILKDTEYLKDLMK